MPAINTRFYQPEAPFEDGLEHPLASESCMVTMLYGACRSLGRIAADMRPEQFVDDIARFGYVDGSWRHRGIGEYLGRIGVNFLSFNTGYDTHDITEMRRVGRLNTYVDDDIIAELMENIHGNSLPRLSRKLHLALGGCVLWGMKAGVNGYNGSVQPTAQHYLGFIEHVPGVGSHLWDPDVRPFDDRLGLRPFAMTAHTHPGTYIFSDDWIADHSNGNVIAVWTDETRHRVSHGMVGNIQLDPDVQIDSRDMLKRSGVVLLQPEVSDAGFNELKLGDSRAIFTYGENIKSLDGETAIAKFAAKIGTEKLAVANTGAHTAQVMTLAGSEFTGREGVAWVCPADASPCDGLIVIDPVLPLSMPGADCPIYVGSGRLKDGTKFIFGAHSGQIGMLRGLNENMVAAISALDVEEGSVEVMVGPSAHTIELDTAYIGAYDSGKHEWRSAVVREYADDQGVQKVVLNVALSVAQSLQGLGPLLRKPPYVVASNTLADRNVWSERGMAMRGELPTKSNTVVIFP